MNDETEPTVTALNSSDIQLRCYVTFGLAGVAPAATPGGLVYDQSGANADDYSAPLVHGTVVEDWREHDGTGCVVVRVDHTVTWRGTLPASEMWRRPRDFRRGHLVVTVADHLTRDELAVLGAQYADACIRSEGVESARAALRDAVHRARGYGLSEIEIAQRAHTTRKTVRALG